MGNSLARIRDIALSFTEDGKVYARSMSKKLAGLFDPMVTLILSFASRPRTREEVAKEFGPSGGLVFDQLEAAGFLVDPSSADRTPHFFHGFTNVNIHRAMLADGERLGAYRRAIEAAVKPGDVVIDAGTGTGILAIYAARAGARKVYAIDNSEYVEIAKRTAAENGLADRIEVIKGDFSQVILPEQADAIVTETFGAMFFTEGASPEIARCAANYLKPGGLILPAEFSLHLACLDEAPNELLDVFQDRKDGVGLDCLLDEARNKAILDRVDPRRVTSSCELCRHPVTKDISQDPLVCRAVLSGPARALCGWFDLHFPSDIHMSTSPFANTASWHQVIFPVELGPGRHELTISLEYNPESRRYMTVGFGDPICRTISV